MFISAALTLGILTSNSALLATDLNQPDSTQQTSSTSITSPDFLDIPEATIDQYQVEIDPSAPNINFTWGNTNPRLRTVWGASYATSYEVAWVSYHGRALAAGNIFAGLRIVQVCIWYTRNNELQSSIVCSNATSDPGAWGPGLVVVTDAWDALAWDAPKTLFNIRTARISTSII
jgi:hypothetical protein